MAKTLSKRTKPTKSRNKKNKKPKDNRHRLRDATIWGAGLPSIAAMREEIQDYEDVLFGRVDCPIDVGVHTLQEYAEGAFARASTMTRLIQQLELDGDINSGRGKDAHPLYKFRTGELRTFMELAKRSADLGSRRLSREELRFKQASTGRESRGYNDD